MRIKKINDKRTCTISVAQMATLSDTTNMASDRIEALAGGHGMVSLSVSTIANVIVEKLMNGASVEVKFANARHLLLKITAVNRKETYENTLI